MISEQLLSAIIWWLGRQFSASETFHFFYYYYNPPVLLWKLKLRIPFINSNYFFSNLANLFLQYSYLVPNYRYSIHSELFLWYLQFQQANDNMLYQWKNSRAHDFVVGFRRTTTAIHIWKMTTDRCSKAFDNLILFLISHCAVCAQQAKGHIRMIIATRITGIIRIMGKFLNVKEYMV